MSINPKRIAREERELDRQPFLGGTPSPSLPPSGPLAPQRKNAISFVTYRVSVVTSGTPVQLPNIAIPSGFVLTIKAFRRNTGIIYVGNTQTNAVNSNQNTFRLSANENIGLEIQNANAVWIDADNATEGCELIVEQ